MTTLKNIGSGFNRSVINDNFDTVEDELNNNVLKRDGVGVGEDNSMKVNLDMNSKRILNLPAPSTDNEPLRVKDLPSTVRVGDQFFVASFTENVVLTSGQTVVNFTEITTVQTAIYISGPNTDTGRLVPTTDYQVDSDTRITLSESYPAGTVVTGVQNESLEEPVSEIRVFDNVEAMKAGNLSVGSTALCKRYYAGGDLVQGLLFNIVAGGTGTDDGGSFHNLANGTQAELINSQYLFPEQWGATDSDCTSILTSIANNNNSGVVKFKNKFYTGKFTAENTFPLSFEGQGELSTSLITPSSTDNGYTVLAGQQFRSSTIKSMSLYQNGFQSFTVGTGTGLNLTSATTSVNYRLEDVSFNWFGIGINSSSNAFSNQLDNVRINFCGTSFRFAGSGQLINHTLNNCYSSQPESLGLFMAGCKDFVFNGYNSGSKGAPHVNIAGGSIGIIFNSPNFEQDANSLGSNTEAIRVQSNSEVTFNYPTFASPSSADATTYLVRVIETAVVYINNPAIIGGDANIRHLRVQDDAVVYLNDPKGVFTKIDIANNGKVIRVDRANELSPKAFGRITSHPAGGLIITGLQTVPVDYDVKIDYASIGDSVLEVLPQVTQLGTGTLKVRYINIITGAENFVARNLIWSAR